MPASGIMRSIALVDRARRLQRIEGRPVTNVYITRNFIIMYILLDVYTYSQFRKELRELSIFVMGGIWQYNLMYSASSAGISLVASCCPREGKCHIRHIHRVYVYNIRIFHWSYPNFQSLGASRLIGETKQ